MSKLPWRRLWAESAIIVSSILLAFAVDAAWDGRLEREREQSALSALSTEISQILYQVQEGRFYTERSRAAAEALLRATRGEAPLDSSTVASGLRYSSLWYIVTPTMTTYDVLVGGGQLDLLSSSGLQAELSGLTMQLSYLRRFEEIEVGFVRQRFRPYVAEHFEMLPTGFAGSDPELARGLALPTATALSTREFRNLLLERTHVALPLLAFHRQLEARLLRLQELVGVDSSVRVFEPPEG